MASYEHLQIARAICELDQPPTDNHEYSSWVRAAAHLQLLRQNAREDEIVVYAYSRPTFIHAVIAKQFEVTPSHTEDLLDWNSNPYTARAGYAWTGPAQDMRVEFADTNSVPSSLTHRQNLVFGRRMEGLDEPYYYELLQEFAHATEIHWREEQRAYCRIDENGDLEPVVSITKRDAKSGLTLITCKREPLEQYLAATESLLVRFFDFTMVKNDEFTSWRGGVRERKVETQNLFFDQCVHPDGHGFTRGAQVLPIATPKQILFRSIIEPMPRRSGRKYTSFIAFDWRNDNVEEISTDPEHTTNYFQTEGNSLPFELSPAFFRPEVLLKYKTDRDKYTIDEATRYIACRGAWALKSYDINEAGQVHAYVCDLRNLPYQEQLHWKSYNEEPKEGISKRAYENDFKGIWSSHITALERILQILRRWVKQEPEWWIIRNELHLLRVNTPVSNSRDEWAHAFLDLSKTVIENFRIRALRAVLRNKGIALEKDDRQLALLEKVVALQGQVGGQSVRLNGLRESQRIRTLAHALSGGSEAEDIAQRALIEYGTYRKHFEHVCNQIAEELEVIEGTLETKT